MTDAPPEIQEEPKQNGPIDEQAEVKKATDTPHINGTTNGDATHQKHAPVDSDPDAQQMVIDSLRTQVQDLFSQVNELNNKLVKSYDRVSDLEDDLHVASANNRSSSLKISQLELERSEHLAALNTGLLVEKAHVTAELTRLMEKATEEAAQRGQAESARQDIEKDLDDLSATLFAQANTMVAEARLAQHRSEQKVDVAERALKGAEEAVAVMQQQMQTFQADKEEAERMAEASMAAVGISGLGRRSSNDSVQSLRLMGCHSPYREFLLFVAHLRSVHPSSPQPPAMTTLLPLPFLARLLSEDSEPTIRLDLAPSLNWLSRRSVLTAIHTGQLIIEPMASTTLLQDISTSGSSTGNNVSCALCGTSIFSTLGASANHSPVPPPLAHSTSGSSSWSTSLFKKPSTSFSVLTTTSAPPTPPSRQSLQVQQPSPSQVYIFRVAAQPSTSSSLSIPSLPRTSAFGVSPSASPQLTQSDHSSHTNSPNPQSATIYPLCTNNWCLARLRATCTLWSFVRTGVIDKIWEEEIPVLPTPAASPTSEKPPIPPRRRGIWGMASALGERATSWGEGDKDKAKRAAATATAPPPVEAKSPDRRRLPPPLPPAKSNNAAGAPAASATEHPTAPPPLPKRSEGRRPSPPVESSAATKPASTEPPAQTAAATATAAVPQDPKIPPRPPRRPLTPASVPLPESRPHTPPVAHTAPASGASAPPPLPRRAAARAPRASPGSDSDNASSTPSQTSAAVESKPEGAEQPKDGSESEQPSSSSSSSPAVAPSPDTSAAAAAAAEGKGSESGKEDEKDEKLAVVEESNANVISSVEEDVFVDAPESVDDKDSGVKEVVDADKAEAEVAKGDDETEKVEEKAEEKAVEEAKKVDEKVEEKSEKSEEIVEVEKVEEKSEKTEEKVEVEKSEGEKAEEKTEESAETDKSETKSEAASATTERVAVEDNKEPEPATEELSPVAKAQTAEKKEGEVDEKGKSGNDDPESIYIGDATWEERTWKEITRLKEDMFWARIGGSRQ
ncbi:hypothetical protein H0H92_003839 [Tricholoma furcatifolium]|nr:hypothetical protein H0H92_003839 [Tricholoma furcatifolium]